VGGVVRGMLRVPPPPTSPLAPPTTQIQLQPAVFPIDPLSIFTAQIAKQVYGCKVIGSAGGPAKCALVTGKFGFDACIDYKTVSTAEELQAALKVHAPEGIDMYFEVCGRCGRVCVCGEDDWE
jgi:hypothetical protein